MNNLNKILVPIAAVAITAGATNAFAAVTLTSIPINTNYWNNQNQNQARAISPDGKYVVGFDGPFSVGGGTTTNGPGFLYDVQNGIRHNNVLGGSYACALTGVGYRTYNAETQLVIDGFANGWHQNWMTTDGGNTWGATRRDVNKGTSPNGPAANSMAGSATDVFYATFRSADMVNVPVWVGKAVGAWPMTPTWDEKGISGDEFALMQAVSSTGRAVGYRGETIKKNYVLQWNGSGTPNSWYFTGLDYDTYGQAFSISADGTVVFGISHAIDDGGVANWGYKAVLSADVPAVDGSTESPLSIDKLPNFADTVVAGSKAYPYGCTADGNYAVGMNNRDVGGEKAVLWDTSDSDTNNWTVTDLTELASSEGALGNFTRLSRAYSVGRKGNGDFVICGIGDYTSDAGPTTRAYVMTISSGTAPAPQPVITSITGAGTGSVTVNYSNTVAGTNYTLRYNTNLNTANWYDVGTKSAAGSSDSQTDNSANTAQRYYRVVIQ